MNAPEVKKEPIVYSRDLNAQTPANKFFSHIYPAILSRKPPPQGICHHCNDEARHFSDFLSFGSNSSRS